MIELNQVNKSFDRIEALRDITLDIQKGSIYGLVGSNGAGKTTLLKILAGVYKQDQGQVTIDSQPVFENNTIKAHMLFIPDFLYFFHNYSIQDMATFYKFIYPDWNQERYLKLQEFFNLDTKRRIKTLSKGMQRQVAFWLGMSIMPDVMILDEPLDGLDPVMRQRVKNLIIQDVADRDMTVIISSHNLRDLEDICDCIGILHQGELLLQKALDDMKLDIHKIQVAFTNGIPANILEDVPVLYREERGSVLVLIARGAHHELIEQIRSHQPAIVDILPLTLEEIFIYEMGVSGYEIKNILY